MWAGMLIFDSLSLCTFEVSLHLLGICGQLTKKRSLLSQIQTSFIFGLFTTIGTVELDLNYCCLHEHLRSMCKSTLLLILRPVRNEKEMIHNKCYAFGIIARVFSLNYSLSTSANVL